MRLSILSSIFSTALLASGCQATWKFQVKHSYLSDLHLQGNDTVPMVYDTATGQIIRVLPANQVVHDINCSCSEHPEPQVNYNTFQAFHSDFTHKKERFIGPVGCPVNDLNVFYEYGSDSSDAVSHLVTGCPNQVSTYDYPCLTQRCNIPSTDGILRTLTSLIGQTYILTQDSLTIVDGNCHTLFTINLCVGSIPCVATDMILNENTQNVIVGFQNGIIGLFTMNNLTFQTNFFLFGAVNTTPFILHTSALSSAGNVFFRAYIGNAVFIYRFDGVTLYSEAEPNEADGAVCISSSDALPLIINDFKNSMDIIVSRQEHHHRLYFSITKVIASGYARQCSSAKMPACFKDQIQPFTGAKTPDCNSFFVGFMPSLNMLHITYEDLVVKA